MKTIGILIGLIFMAILLALLCSLPVWLLWNWLMPEIFDLREITWLQALGLTILCNFLFKSSSSSSSSSKE